MRRLLAQPAKAYAQGPKINVDDWVRAMEVSSRRAGLLACGDLSAALDQLSRRLRLVDEGGEPNTESRARTSSVVEARDLILFYLSDNHFVLRRMAGIDS